MSINKRKMLELTCPNCGKVFFRTEDLARTVTTCPACHARLTFNKEGKVALIKQVKYARGSMKAVSTIAGRVQRLLGSKYPRRTKRIGLLERIRTGRVGSADLRRRGALKIHPKVTPGLKGGFDVPRRTLAHEIAHVSPRIHAAHGPVHKSTRRQVEKVMKRTGAMKRLKKMGYAREDPKYVKTRFAEMKQHKVPFRTRMQVLSREYGGRGGYTSEELHKIITGKTTSAYYIFPFVKGAPPEVNRILERTYRKHRTAGDSKVAAAIAAWTKVKQAGYVKQTKPAPVWVKKGSYNMKQLKPMQITNYGAGAAAGSLTERGVRNLWAATRRHPRFMGSAGAFGAGYLTHKHLKRRRKRKQGYQIDVRHFTPNIKTPFDPKVVLKKQFASGVAAGKRIGKTMSTAAKFAIVGLALKEVMDFLERKKDQAPWLPDIQHDVELSRYQLQALNLVIDYAPKLHSKVLQTIGAKTGAALHRTKTGVERGLLVWLLGFLSSELMGRGISKPQRRHEVIFPEKHSLYDRFHVGETGERLPRWGFQSFTPTKTTKDPLPRWPGRPIRKRRLGRKIGSAAALPLAALLAVRLSKNRREGYSFGSAAKKTLRGMKKVSGGIGKVGGVVGKGLGKVYPAAMTALIVSEFWPRKRKLPQHPPVQTSAYPYGLIKGLRRLAKLRKVKAPPAVGHKLRDLTLSRKDPALAELNKRLAAAAQKMKKFQLVETYPMKSKAQRRWMHWKKPKMAKEWEEHTPEGKKLPEKVSKHFLGVPILTPIILAKILASKKKKKQYALQAPLLWRRARSVKHLFKTRILGRDLATWAREVEARMRKLAASTQGQKLTVKGVSTSAPQWFGKEAAKWDQVARQAQDMVIKGQLEKVGLLAAGTAAGITAHEVGKKRERARVHKVVG